MPDHGSAARTSWAVPITVALIGAIATIGAALLSNDRLLDRLVGGTGSPPPGIPATPAPRPPASGAAVDPSPAPPTAATGCVVTIRNPLVALRREPDTFSDEVVRVPAGDYAVRASTATTFGSEQQSWLQIAVDGRSGWIRNDTWTIEQKTAACP